MVLHISTKLHTVQVTIDIVHHNVSCRGGSISTEADDRSTSKPAIVSPEIDSISLHNAIPLHLRLYGLPFLCTSATGVSVLVMGRANDSAVSSSVLHVLSQIRRMGQIGRMDVYLLRIAVRRTRSVFPLHGLEQLNKR